MRDLYKRLKLSDQSTDQQIRSALARAAPDVKNNAEFVLLDPRRRAVYDRNRELLLTIAQLRFDLGLNYTPFWSRRQFKDFWKTPEFAFPTAQNEAPKRRVDKMMIAQAFHTVRHHGRHHAARWGWWWAAGIMIVGGCGIFFILWHASF